MSKLQFNHKRKSLGYLIKETSGVYFLCSRRLKNIFKKTKKRKDDLM